MSQAKPPRSAIAIAALGVELSASTEAPSDFRILPAGKFRAWDGRPTDCPAWVCNEEDGQRIVAELSARVSQRVIDYEHSTLHAKKDGGKAPAAGWFKSAEWRDDGLWLTGVDWTTAAAQAIVAKEYRYVSPVFPYDPQTGRVLGLFCAALTNNPGVDGLTDLVALAADIFLPSTNSPENSMNEMLKKLLAALGLQETATEAEALSAVATMRTNVATLSAQVSTPDPSRFVPIATLTALQGEHASLQGKLAALQAEVSGGKVDKIVTDALAAGKLTPATEAWARELGKTNVAALSAFIAAAPVIAAPGSTQTGGKKPGDDGKTLTDQELAVCSAMGIDPEAYRKTNA